MPVFEHGIVSVLCLCYFIFFISIYFNDVVRSTTTSGRSVGRTGTRARPPAGRGADEDGNERRAGKRHAWRRYSDIGSCAEVFRREFKGKIG